METVPQSTRDWLAKQLTADFQIEKHSYSHQDDVYKIQTPEKNAYLKIASTLEAERENILKTQPYLQVPEVLAFSRLLGKDHLLMSEVPGRNLAELVGEWENSVIVQEFAKAVRQFHSLEVSTIFPNNTTPGLVVLHGDMSLPNIICTTPGSISYIDLGQMAVGSLDIDLADAIWSLQRNLGPEYGELFLKEYGDVVMTEKLDKALHFRYSS
jgi:aminoglycoside phosphotransferase